MDQVTYIKDKIRGSLMAAAAGDALGYAVEFINKSKIDKLYGSDGITAFELNGGKALISDDTQMSLFTANGLLMGVTRCAMRGIGSRPEEYVYVAYRDWYYTQTRDKRIEDSYSWLRALPQMYSLRAPGITCMNACESIVQRDEPQNNSKGCGGIMRVAPIALLHSGYIARARRFYTHEELARAGVTIARCTHKHPLGFLPAALLTLLLAEIITMSPEEVALRIESVVAKCLSVVGELYGVEYRDDVLYLEELTQRALRVAHSHLTDVEAISLLGQGWTADEAWAIALYCAVRHIDSVERAIIAAVNHDGDSDSTGSICGNVMGAIYGYNHIAERRIFCPTGRSLEQTLELSDVILAIADDLSTSCFISEYDALDTPEKQQWFERYCEMKPSGIRQM